MSAIVPLASAELIYFFFFNDTATTEIYTLSLHDALPISGERLGAVLAAHQRNGAEGAGVVAALGDLEVAHVRRVAQELARSEEHTSELQSRLHLVCRLLLEKKKNTTIDPNSRRSDTATRT